MQKTLMFLHSAAMWGLSLQLPSVDRKKLINPSLAEACLICGSKDQSQYLLLLTAPAPCFLSLQTKCNVLAVTCIIFGAMCGF